MSIHILLDVYAALFGLIVGSYLNVVIHRLPRGVSTVLPRSRCGHCGARIRARDNVPVLSWLLLRGRLLLRKDAQGIALAVIDGDGSRA